MFNSCDCCARKETKKGRHKKKRNEIVKFLVVKQHKHSNEIFVRKFIFFVCLRCVYVKNYIPPFCSPASAPPPQIKSDFPFILSFFFFRRAMMTNERIFVVADDVSHESSQGFLFRAY